MSRIWWLDDQPGAEPVGRAVYTASTRDWVRVFLQKLSGSFLLTAPHPAPHVLIEPPFGQGQSPQGGVCVSEMLLLWGAGVRFGTDNPGLNTCFSPV